MPHFTFEKIIECVYFLEKMYQGLKPDQDISIMWHEEAKKESKHGKNSSTATKTTPTMRQAV